MSTVNPSLSDLFFNHTHPHYDDCSIMSPDHLEAHAIYQDAENFLDDYWRILAPTVIVSAKELADDFMDRL